MLGQSIHTKQKCKQVWRVWHSPLNVSLADIFGIAMVIPHQKVLCLFGCCHTVFIRISKCGVFLSTQFVNAVSLDQFFLLFQCGLQSLLYICFYIEPWTFTWLLASAWANMVHWHGQICEFIMTLINAAPTLCLLLIQSIFLLKLPCCNMQISIEPSIMP